MAIRSAPPNFDSVEAERVARDLYGLAAKLERLPGERDANFHARTTDGRDFVLKIIDGAAQPAATECLVRVLQHVAEHDPGLAVPRVHTTLRGQDLGGVDRNGTTFATCLTSYLPGSLLLTATPQSELLRHVGDTAARVDCALQGFFHPALAQPIAWDVRRLPALIEHSWLLASADLRGLVEAATTALQRRLPALRGLRSQAIHGDCHPGNLLVGGTPLKVTGVLDFGDVIHAPRVMELAVMLAELLMDGVADFAGLAMVIDGYSQRQKLEAADIDALTDLIAARHATTLLLHAWRRSYDPAGARLLERSAANAPASLERLLCDGSVLTRDWRAHQACDFGDGDSVAVNLSRRHRLLGGGAELFYETPLHLVRGEGVWLFDSADCAYLDVYNNVPHVGHCHPTVVAAIQRQTGQLVTHTRYLHSAILDYAERLTATLPAHLDACIFVNSGSEANDVAWRMARFATGHQGGIVMAHAYHGITEAVAALTPGSGEAHDPRVVTLALPPAGLRVDDSMTVSDLKNAIRDVEHCLRALAERALAPAAFFIDSALTSSGIFDPPPSWLTAVVARVRAAGALVVADEVQYGLGRSGSDLWGFMRRGISPDIVTLGKPIGNGYPMGVVIAGRALVEAFQAQYGFFSTFGGNPVAAAAGLAVFTVLEREQLQANAQQTGDYLRRRLEEMAVRHTCLGAVRGAGLLLGLEIHGINPLASKRRTQNLVNRLASQARVLTGAEGPLGNILKLRPPLSFRTEHVDLLVRAIDGAATDLDATP